MGWNINFDGKTKLKDWWGVARDNFIYLKKLITDIDNSIGMRIAEARGINPTKHIVESTEDKSEWLITDHYLVPVPTTDGKVVHEEYAYVDGTWQVIGSTKEADLSGYYNKAEVENLLSTYQKPWNLDENVRAINVNSASFDVGCYQESETDENGYVVKEMFLLPMINSGEITLSYTTSTNYYIDRPSGIYYLPDTPIVEVLLNREVIARDVSPYNGQTVEDDFSKDRGVSIEVEKGDILGFRVYARIDPTYFQHSDYATAKARTSVDEIYLRANMDTIYRYYDIV